jgi:hypothetical protein
MTEETENLWKELVALREELQREREQNKQLKQQLEALKSVSPANCIEESPDTSSDCVEKNV